MSKNNFPFEQFANWTPYSGNQGTLNQGTDNQIIPVSDGIVIKARSIFVERVYQIFNQVHPTLIIDTKSVAYVCLILARLFFELIETRPTTREDIENRINNIFTPTMCHWAKKHIQSDKITKYKNGKKLAQDKSLESKTRFELFQKISRLSKENLTYKLPETASLLILSIIEYVAHDVLQWGGSFAKNIEGNKHIVKNGKRMLDYNNLKTAIKADANFSDFQAYLLRNCKDDETLLIPFENQSKDKEFELFDIVKQEEICYDKILKSMVEDISRYIRDLNLLLNVFKKNMENGFSFYKLENNYIEKCFGNIDEIYNLTLKVQGVLEDSFEMPNIYNVGQGLIEFVEGLEYSCYLEYIHIFQVPTDFFDCMIKDENLQQYYDREDQMYRNTPNGTPFRLAIRYILPELLKSPVRYFFRFIEQVNLLCKYSMSDDDQSDLGSCRSILIGLGQQVEMQASRMINFNLKNDIQSAKLAPLRDNKIMLHKKDMIMRDIQSKIEGWQGANIVATSTRYIHEGILMKIRHSGKSVTETIKGKFSSAERYVFFFDQTIVITKKLNQPKTNNATNSVVPVDNNIEYKFKEQIKLKASDIMDLEDCDEYTNAFKITSYSSCNNHDGMVSSILILAARSSEEKEKWMFSFADALSSTLLDRILDAFLKDESFRIPLYFPNPEKYKFAEPNREDNIQFEDYTHSNGAHVVKFATLTKLIERLTYHKYHEPSFMKTFLTTYRTFCEPLELLNLLIARFNVPIPDELSIKESIENKNSGSLFIEQASNRFKKEYQRPVQMRVLVVLQYWIKDHWYDFENNNEIINKMIEFFDGKLSEHPFTKQQKSMCHTITEAISKKRRNTFNQEKSFDSDTNDNDSISNSPPLSSPGIIKYQHLWHTAKKGDVDDYGLLTLHPVEIARQLTIIHAELYKAVKPIELCNAVWTKRDNQTKSPQLLKLIHASNELTYWIQWCIVHEKALEDRVAMYSRAIEIMLVLEELNNFTGIIAVISALNASPVYRLQHTKQRVDKEKMAAFDRFDKLCDRHHTGLIKRLKIVDPPVVPFFGMYLTRILHCVDANETFVQKDKISKHIDDDEILVKENDDNKEPLISFLKCRKQALLIREIQMYQDKPYDLVPEPSIKAFLENINVSGSDKDKTTFENYLFEQSHLVEPKDFEKLEQVKSNYSPATIKSPGIKTPKKPPPIPIISPSTMIMSAQQPPLSPSTTSTNNPQSEENDFAIINIKPGTFPKYLGDAPSRSNENKFFNHNLSPKAFKNLAARLNQRALNNMNPYHPILDGPDHVEIDESYFCSPSPSAYTQDGAFIFPPIGSGLTKSFPVEVPTVFAPKIKERSKVAKLTDTVPQTPPRIIPRASKSGTKSKRESTSSQHSSIQISDLNSSCTNTGSNESLGERIPSPSSNNHTMRPRAPSVISCKSCGQAYDPPTPPVEVEESTGVNEQNSNNINDLSTSTTSIPPPIPARRPPALPPKSEKIKKRIQQLANKPPPLFPRRPSLTTTSSTSPTPSFSKATSGDTERVGTMLVPPALPPKTYKKTRTDSTSRR
uniref:PH domain-containing protein n=1 Tax=Parastrongyloides trichosuri TaxID=131310 RepID=A0A0N4Z0X9_PARTI